MTEYYSKSEAISREDFKKICSLIKKIPEADFSFDQEGYYDWTKMDPGIVTLRFKGEEIHGSCSLLTNYMPSRFKLRRHRFQKATLLSARAKDIMRSDGYSGNLSYKSEEFIFLFYDKK